MTSHEIARKWLDGPDMPVVVQGTNNYELDDWFETDQGLCNGGPFYCQPENIREDRGDVVVKVIMLA